MSTEKIQLSATSVVDGVTVTLSVHVAHADLEKLLEAQEHVFSSDEAADLVRVTHPALLPALHQARDQWLQSLWASWYQMLNDRMNDRRSA